MFLRQDLSCLPFTPISCLEFRLVSNFSPISRLKFHLVSHFLPRTTSFKKKLVSPTPNPMSYCEACLSDSFFLHLSFYQMLSPQNHKGPLLWWKTQNFVGLLTLMARKKCFLHWMQSTKKQLSAMYVYWKNHKQLSKMALKNGFFGSFSWFFQRLALSYLRPHRTPPHPQNCTKNRASWDSRFFCSFELYKTPSKGGPWLVKVKLLKLCRTTQSCIIGPWVVGPLVNNRKRPCTAKGPVNLGDVLSCRTEGVRSTPGVRGGASTAFSAVPKSRELGQLGAA